MSNTVVAHPAVCKPIVKGGRSFAMLAPLAGVSAQDNAPYISDWLPVGAGAFLQLTLTVGRITGTVLVYLETVNNPKTDRPRFCGAFQQTSAPGSAQEGFLSDRFVRVVAVAGAGAGQRADWMVTGNAYVGG